MDEKSDSLGFPSIEVFRTREVGEYEIREAMIPMGLVLLLSRMLTREPGA